MRKKSKSGSKVQISARPSMVGGNANLGGGGPQLKWTEFVGLCCDVYYSCCRENMADSGVGTARAVADESREAAGGHLARLQGGVSKGTSRSQAAAGGMR